MFSVEETEQNVHEPGTELDVELRRKSGGGFGLNIVGGTDSTECVSNNGVYISSISDGGPAQESGKLHIGDRILKINDFSLVDIKHAEAVDAFRNAGEVIKLKIQKVGQLLQFGKLPTDMVDAPRPISSSATPLQRTKKFLNSWVGAMLIGTVAGMVAMFTFTKLSKLK